MKRMIFRSRFIAGDHRSDDLGSDSTGDLRGDRASVGAGEATLGRLLETAELSTLRSACASNRRAARHRTGTNAGKVGVLGRFIFTPFGSRDSKCYAAN